MVGVGGTHHSMLGVVNIEVAFGTLGLKYQFYIVEDLHHSLILGHDIMETHNVTLDLRGKTMTIQDSLKVCSLHTIVNTGYACTVKPTTIYANSEVEIPVKIARLTKDEEVILEPLARLSQDNILGPKCLAKEYKGKAVLRLIHSTENNIDLKGNKVLAVVSQIAQESIFALDTDLETTSNVAQNVPNQVNKPTFKFNLDNSDLNESQKQELLKLLEANTDFFFQKTYII